MYKQIDKPTLQQFRIDFKNEIAAFEKKTGLTLKLGAIKYSPNDNEFTVTLTGALNLPGKNAAEEKYKRYSPWFDVEPDTFGKTFTNGGSEYKIVGIEPSRKKFPIVANNTKTGKELLFPAAVTKTVKK